MKYYQLYLDDFGADLALQIRIVTDTHEGSGGEGKAKKKKKKPHRGYAFIVYERERDMKGMCCPLLRSFNRSDHHANPFRYNYKD